jgi:hypothetical protein
LSRVKHRMPPNPLVEVLCGVDVADRHSDDLEPVVHFPLLLSRSRRRQVSFALDVVASGRWTVRVGSPGRRVALGVVSVAQWPGLASWVGSL